MFKTLLLVIVLAALGLAGCSGGDGDDESDSSTGFTGLCNPCASVADCLDGFQCQPCQEGCSAPVMRCTGSTGDGALSCTDGVFPAGCVNIAGRWTFTERVTGTCTVGGETDPLEEEGTGSVVIQQTGCNISYTVPDTSIVRSGLIVGNRIHLTGPFLMALQGNVSFRENTVTIEGTVMGDALNATGSGRGSGRVDGVDFSCTGTSTASGERE